MYLETRERHVDVENREGEKNSKGIHRGERWGLDPAQKRQKGERRKVPIPRGNAKNFNGFSTSSGR